MYAECPVPTTEPGFEFCKQRLFVGVVVRGFTDGNGYLRTSWLIC